MNTFIAFLIQQLKRQYAKMTTIGIGTDGSNTSVAGGNQLKRTLPSIRLLISVMVLAPMVAISLALLILSGYTSSRIESQLSKSLVRATSTVVTREINSVIRDAQWVSDLYAYRIETGVLPGTPDPPPWDKLMVGTLSMRSSLASLTYATPDGRCVMVMRVGGKLIASHSDGPGAFQTREYEVTAQGKAIEPPIRTYAYDVAQRPWYGLAIRSKAPAWTPVYAWFEQSHNLRDGPPIAGLGYTRSIRKPDGSMLGVLSVDVSLETVGKLLGDSDVAGRGTLAILDDKDHLLCDSAGLTGRDATRLPLLDTVPGEDMRVLREHLDANASPDTGLQALVEHRYVSVEPIRPFPGINWRLAMVVPEQVINGETSTLERNMVLVGAACVGTALLLGLWLSQRIAAPVQRMVASVRRIGDGDFNVTFAPQRTRELAELTGALSEMTTDLKEQVTLRAAKEAAESANRAKSAFFARATHELRTPLNAIIGYSELIEEHDAVRQDAQAHDDIRRVLQASRQLLGVINNVLDLARIESGKLSISLADAPVEPLLRESAETAQPLAKQNGNALRLEIRDDIGTLRTDAGKLKQILLNLLANAARFTRDGTITLLAERDQSHLHLAIRDTGCGIAADNMRQLFEPFYQADARRGGTGLGLSISRQLTQALGGAIEVTSVEGQGTTIDLYFPLHPPLNPAAADATGADGPAGPREDDAIETDAGRNKEVST